MSITVHIVSRLEPITHLRQNEQAICGDIVEKATPATIVPDITLASVGIISDSFGTSMCGYCQLCEEKAVGWVYFMLSSEDARKLQRAQELAEIG